MRFFLFSKSLLTVCQHTGKLFLAEKVACLFSEINIADSEWSSKEENHAPFTNHSIVS